MESPKVPLRLASYNVKGVLNPVKRSKILGKMKKDKVDIIFLQETHLTESEHAKLKRQGFNQVYSSSYKTGRRRGVATLITKRLIFEKISETSDKEGRYNMLVGKLEGSEVTLLNVYVPPGATWEFYRQVFDLMITKARGMVICGGDFNLRLNPKWDVSRPTQTNTISKKVRKMMSEMGICDVWRELNPTTRDYTFYSSPHKTYSRIDYFFMYSKDIGFVKSCKIGIMDLSDHSPVYLDLNFKNNKNSFSWRLNLNALKGKMKKELQEEIRLYLSENDNGEVSPLMVWDAGKAVLRGKIIAKLALQKRLRQEKLNKLEKELENLEKKHKKDVQMDTTKKIKEIKNQIKEIYEVEIQKKLIFLKQNYYEVGNKSAKILAYKLKKQQAERVVYKITDPITKQIKLDFQDIHSCFEKYYKNLYTRMVSKGNKTPESLLASLNLPTITEDQNKVLLANVTIEELQQAISRLKPNKSPGSDGFTAEWYKTFSDLLSPLLLRTFNWAIKNGEIPPSWREAIITVIPKDGKDKTDCSSYRPISLLNQDYKLFTSILAKRLEIILPDIIQLDQTGFIKQRQTQDNVRRTIHVINHINQDKLEAVLLGLDAEKAFDSVDWSFLYKTLERFQFHNDFVKVIQALYFKPTAKIRINGGLSNNFELERGCRQGCPISPLLFAIFIEPLSQWIRQNEKIKGIMVSQEEHKIALFADDILIYLGHPSASFPELLTILKEYGLLSGYKLNTHKSQILTFRYSPSHSIREEFKVNWESKSIKYLGVNIPKHLNLIIAENYDILFSKIKSDLTRWNLIPFLGLGQRVEVIKMNLLPRLLYLFQNIPVELPKGKFQELDKLISRFIWQGKKPRIRYKTLQLAKDKGGLALPNIKNYHQAAQIKILVNICNPSYKAKWKDIECQISSDIPIQAIIGDSGLINCLKDVNPWIKMSMRTWHRVINENKANEPYWIIKWIGYDVDFLPNRMDARFKQWADKGLAKYSDFFEGGILRQFQDLKNRFSLTNQDFYRFLQVRHYLNNIMKKEEVQQTNLGLLKIFLLSYRSDPGRGNISKIYKVLRELEGGDTAYIKEKWEKESNITIRMEIWGKIILQKWKSTFSLSWREFGWKNVVRFFRVPAQRTSLGRNTTCWRACGESKATHYHMFWECPVITKYWEEIKLNMEKIMKIVIPSGFETLYLGLRPDTVKGPENRYMYNILLLASTKAITRKWLVKDSPTIEDWIRVVKDIFTMEKLTFILRLEQEKFKSYWKGWTNYLTNDRQEV